MDSNLNKIEEIMKPYFDKVEELENEKIESQKLPQDAIEQIEVLEEELNKIAKRKNASIEEFKRKQEVELKYNVSQMVYRNSKDKEVPESVVESYKKMLQNYYDKQLKAFIKGFEDVTNQKENGLKEEIERIKESNKKVDLTTVHYREIADIKQETRSKLEKEKEKLELELSELKDAKKLVDSTLEELNIYREKQSVTMKLISEFKPEFGENGDIINKQAWDDLLKENKNNADEISKLTNKLEDNMSVLSKIEIINNSINKIDEYLNVTILTVEEQTAEMLSTPNDEKLYIERKNSKAPNQDDVIELDYEKQDDNKIIVENEIDLRKAIYNDIIKEISSMRTVKLVENEGELTLGTKEESNGKYEFQEKTLNLEEESIQLPNGEYLNSDDFEDALERFSSKEKGRTYVVKDTNKEYRVSKGKIAKLRRKLKECSAIKLLREDKLQKSDVTRVFGRVKGEWLFRKSQIGSVLNKTSMPEGEYINRNELISKLDNVIKINGLKWLKDLANKVKQTYKENVELREVENHRKEINKRK